MTQCGPHDSQFQDHGKVLGMAFSVYQNEGLKFFSYIF